MTATRPSSTYQYEASAPGEDGRGQEVRENQACEHPASMVATPGND